METIQPCEKSQENQQKKTKLENERQVLLMKEVDSVSNSDLTGREKYNQQLAQKYLDWIQKYCRRWYFELWTISVCMHTLSPSLHFHRHLLFLSEDSSKISIGSNYNQIPVIMNQVYFCILKRLLIACALSIKERVIWYYWCEFIFFF